MVLFWIIYGIRFDWSSRSTRAEKFLGIELDKEYHAIAEKRLHDALNGTLRYREIDKPILIPQKQALLRKIHF